MEIPHWTELVKRARYWAAFVGVRRLVTGAVSVVVALLVLWLMMRPSDPPLESSMATASVASPTSHASLARTGQVTVHVMGAVRRPGVYQLSSTARVVDAVREAGGATSSADLERINLAQTLIDTEQIFVPSRQQPTSRITIAPRIRSNTSTVAPSIPGATPTTTLPSEESASNSTGKVNINTATAAQLDTLPGVGPSTAKAIISYRTKSGAFKKISDLMNVPGIGQAKFDAMRDLVSV